jgi:hypothetical protein
MINCSSEKLSQVELLDFLNLNPTLAQSLLSGCNHNIDEVSTLIQPVLSAPERCHLTPFYIHAVSLGRIAFLVTNLHSGNANFDATSPATSWSIGRSPSSGIRIAERSISRCHAVISHHAFSNFFMTDAGSLNGTWVNGVAIAPQERRVLHDGDILRFGSISAEFFSLMRWEEGATLPDITYS